MDNSNGLAGCISFFILMGIFIFWGLILWGLWELIHLIARS